MVDWSLQGQILTHLSFFHSAHSILSSTILFLTNFRWPKAPRLITRQGSSLSSFLCSLQCSPHGLSITLLVSHKSLCLALGQVPYYVPVWPRIHTMLITFKVYESRYLMCPPHGFPTGSFLSYLTIQQLPWGRTPFQTFLTLFISPPSLLLS